MSSRPSIPLRLPLRSRLVSAQGTQDAWILEIEKKSGVLSVRVLARMYRKANVAFTSHPSTLPSLAASFRIHSIRASWRFPSSENISNILLLLSSREAYGDEVISCPEKIASLTLFACNDRQKHHSSLPPRT